MEKYLDIEKSIVISSPAGSGKTEKLARRYVSLLLGGSGIEKILAITFTEKAAAEMKDRILRILEKEDPGMFISVREKMPLMRISTIHAFCLKLLKRFSIELGLDPIVDVMDEFNASILWSESVYESLMEEKDSPDLFFDMMVNRGVRGWNSLVRILNELQGKRPHPELMVKGNHRPEGEEGRILELYSRCLERYRSKKTEKNLIDFDDIELLAYEALMTNPQWQNILYSFDEHTDHLLVDEFQDTSTLQWKIIEKLIEEWISGVGAKRNAGKLPTVFLVGDEKQSIYLFRGANVSVFHEAKEKLSGWLGDEFHFEEVRENYRSLPAIVNFTNNLFSRIMPPALYESWRTRYTPFEATRSGDGRVELVLLEGEESTKRSRELEASVLSKRIQSLVNRHEVWEEDVKKRCTYADMAVLLRKRTHLSVFEDSFRRYGIPFIVLKGIGFYDEPEVAVLRELLSVLIDPLDDYSLFCLLRSPIFGIDYKALVRLVQEDLLRLEQIGSLKNKKVKKAYDRISDWTARARYTPLAILLEDALSETGGWVYFWEKQRQVNIKKFVGIIEHYESQGFSGLDIREKLITARFGEEAKANVNTEGMNVVKVMTVHAAKGLQFPMVFLPSLDEDNVPRSSSLVFEEEDETISFAYEENPTRRKKIAHFQRRKEKELEEDKRLFYVAVTRAQDFLCMLGAPGKGKGHAGRLAYITDNLAHLSSLNVLDGSDVDRLYSSSQRVSDSSWSSEDFFTGPVYIEPLSYEPAVRWRDVTEDLDIRTKHGDDWVLLGIVFHSLFEELSKTIIRRDQIEKRASTLLRNEVSGEKEMNRLMDTVRQDFEKLEISGCLKDIILPAEKAYAELPFILRKGNTVFRGRIDRIIVRNGTVDIYDYKTFPVKEKELPELLQRYRFQMDIYKEAAEKILAVKAKGHLLFTHMPFVVEI